MLARHNLPIVHPFVFLLLTVVYSTYSGGLRPGLISGMLMSLYAVHYLSEPGTILLLGIGGTPEGIIAACASGSCPRRSCGAGWLRFSTWWRSASSRA